MSCHNDTGADVLSRAPHSPIDCDRRLQGPYEGTGRSHAHADYTTNLKVVYKPILERRYKRALQKYCGLFDVLFQVLFHQLEIERVFFN